MTKLLTYSNPKIQKSNADTGYLTAIMHLEPAKKSGYNVCKFATYGEDGDGGCAKVCLDISGHGGIGEYSTNPVHIARHNRTILFFKNRKAFDAQLIKEIEAHVRKATKLELIPAIRLNGTSDIPWERLSNIFDMFPQVIFYDYTKYPFSHRPTESLPKNYSLTLSRSEKTRIEAIRDSIANGRNVAVVFFDVPDMWEGIHVIDGDKHDMRFLDSTGVIVGLKAKGPAKKDTSGFVVNAFV